MTTVQSTQDEKTAEDWSCAREVTTVLSLVCSVLTKQQRSPHPSQILLSYATWVVCKVMSALLLIV